MSRIEINGGGHQVIVDHDGGDLAYVVEKAEKLWAQTKSAEPPPGPAYGFSMERDRGLYVHKWCGEFEPVRAVESGGPDER